MLVRNGLSLQDSPLPGAWEERIGHSFSKLLLIKTFREEKLLLACTNVSSLTASTSCSNTEPTFGPTLFGAKAGAMHPHLLYP
jgi:hypothetical protein